MNEPIDITPGGPIPPGDPAVARRRQRAGLLAAGAVAVVVAGGVGYAALSRPVERRSVVLPAVSVPVVPFSGDLLPAPGAGPSAVPVAKSAAESAPASPSATRSEAPSLRPGTKPGAESGRTPPAVRAPASPAGPQDGARPLTAWYVGGGKWREDGQHRYAGTLTLSDPAAKAGWRIRLTVPGGNRVHAGSDVRVRQNGERVTFTPGPDGAVSFDFRVDGVLSAEPYDCLINGHACG